MEAQIKLSLSMTKLYLAMGLGFGFCSVMRNVETFCSHYCFQAYYTDLELWNVSRANVESSLVSGEGNPSSGK